MAGKEDIPLILGRPFLATIGTLIDVQNGTMIFRAGDEHVIFRMRTENPNNPSKTEEACELVIVLDYEGLEEVSSTESRIDAQVNNASGQQPNLAIIKEDEMHVLSKKRDRKKKVKEKRRKRSRVSSLHRDDRVDPGSRQGS
ncbi:hypothetical protein L1987_47919 [Smallanthus sonchifolius]|uniref:Uncharacterized protein n=1 Tax=Smallanthus sonchifolius TaxID=185202 RepID=A0ACB9FQK4_9ASTR|nr:hypothetical protein L1987_47919 [Smallanthus sonchifolius]